MSESESVTVVGAGIVGLSVAWHLLKKGVPVTVIEQSSVSAGASFGNAGWISPGLATPLPEPSVVKFGLKSLTDRNSPLYIPPTTDGNIMNFAVRFARNCTRPRWNLAMKALLPLNETAIEGYEEIASGSGYIDDLTPKKGPILAAFRSRAEAVGLQEELYDIVSAGGSIESHELSGSELTDDRPFLDESVTFALLLLGQRFLDSNRYCLALAKEVEALGGTVRLGQRVLGVEPLATGSKIRLSDGNTMTSNKVVLAIGAWTPTLTRKLGVKVAQAAGRGYSFGVQTDVKIEHPIYFPLQRIACTPLAGGLRIAGTMEIASPLDAYDPRRVDAIIRSATGLLKGVDLQSREQEWVGPRPITEDGLPIIGPTLDENIWVAAGHGMWGVTYGPVTGRLVAEGLIENKTPSSLRPFSPLRRT